MDSEEIVEINSNGVVFTNAGETYKWEKCGFTSPQTFMIVTVNEEILSFTLDNGSLKIDFNYKMPAWIIYDRVKGKETFFGFWVSLKWSDNAISNPDALIVDRFVNINIDKIDFT